MTNKHHELYQNIFDAIRRASHVMLVMHQKPDGDTAGSSLAMAHYLDTISKPHTCFCIDELSPTLHFLPGRTKITTDRSHWHPKKAQFNLLMVFDSGDLHYCGISSLIEELRHEFVIINIDHHITNTHYGQYNLVVPTASSTCEIVHGLLSSINALNREMATCLMTGLFTDTGGFTNLATTAASMEAASELLLKGVNIRTITSSTMRHRSVASLRLWGKALERLTLTTNGIAITVITQEDLSECRSSDDAAEGVANFLNMIDDHTGAKVICVLSERIKGVIKGSLRTTHPLIDVSKLATLFGGGGHKKAAGFTLNGHLRFQQGEWSIHTTSQP